jgi:hypothetical protein
MAGSSPAMTASMTFVLVNDAIHDGGAGSATSRGAKT